MPVVYQKGDLLASGADIIFHGVNCFCAMSGGIAKQIAEKYPFAEWADSQTPYGEKEKLGTIQVVYPSIDYSAFSPIVINAYTQYNLGSDFSIIHLHSCMNELKSFLKNIDPYRELRVAGPKIGCGIGGGNWNLVQSSLNSIFPIREIEIYTL